jgi:hypothetical protein
MAIARDILSGLFGATAGGLRGYATRQAEERERMQRQLDIMRERQAAARSADRRAELRSRLERRAGSPEVIRSEQGIFTFDPASGQALPVISDGETLQAIQPSPAAPRRNTVTDVEGYVYEGVVGPDGSVSYQPVMVPSRAGEGMVPLQESTESVFDRFMRRALLPPEAGSGG